MWNDYAWLYSTEFTMPTNAAGHAGDAGDTGGGMSYSLVLDGVKMGAEIYVNGFLYVISAYCAVYMGS